jgi:hypothetical protein
MKETKLAPGAGRQFAPRYAGYDTETFSPDFLGDRKNLACRRLPRLRNAGTDRGVAIGTGLSHRLPSTAEVIRRVA